MAKHPAWLGKAMQSGGRIQKQFGGELDSGRPLKEKAAAELQKRDDVGEQSVRAIGKGALGTVLGALGPKFKQMGPVGKTLKGGVLGGGLGQLAAGAAGLRRSYEHGEAADEANKAGDKAEGHKRGGRAKRKR